MNIFDEKTYLKQAGICPICGSNNWTITDDWCEGEAHFKLVECGNCGAQVNETYELTSAILKESD